MAQCLYLPFLKYGFHLQHAPSFVGAVPSGPQGSVSGPDIRIERAFVCAISYDTRNIFGVAAAFFLRNRGRGGLRVSGGTFV